MKKVLFATTALIASAGMASAQGVALSGSAEMGIFGGDTLGVGAAAGTVVSNDPSFWTHIDVTFTLSGETDNGLTFGGSVDLDEADNINDDGTDGVAIFISGDFGTLTMGDTDSAMDFILTEAGNIGNPGSISDNETIHVGYNGDYADGGRILRYDYSFDAFTIAISGQPELSDNYAIGVGYEFGFAGGSVDVGLAYQQEAVNARYAPGGLAVALDILNGGDGINSANISNSAADGDFVLIDTGLAGDVTILGISAVVALDSGFTAGFEYSDWEFQRTAASAVFGAAGRTDATHLGIGAGYEFDAFSVHANYGRYEVAGVEDITGYGFAAAYDLGGGASIHLGWGSSQPGNGVDDIQNYSFGVAMSF